MSPDSRPVMSDRERPSIKYAIIEIFFNHVLKDYEDLQQEIIQMVEDIKTDIIEGRYAE